MTGSANIVTLKPIIYAEVKIIKLNFGSVIKVYNFKQPSFIQL